MPESEIHSCQLVKKTLVSAPLSSVACRSLVNTSSYYLLPTIMTIIEKIEKEQLKADVADFKVGDTVKVHTRVVEGGKERVQIFAGIVIGRKGGNGINAAFTVRKISYGEGVERIFPLHTPRISKIEVTNKGKVRRAKLNYLRQRVGKRATLVKSMEIQ